jgi:branched-chain amino acid transport system permease protein
VVAFTLPESLKGPVVTLVSEPNHHLSVFGRWQDPALWQALCDSSRQSAEALSQCSPFPMNRLFIMLCALMMMALLWGVLNFTRLGLIIKAALTQPQMVEALGHDVPSVFMLVFGLGTALAGLAGVIGGSTFITEPAMAASVGSVTFVVVVVGGMGSLVGAFLASILIGMNLVATAHSTRGFLASQPRAQFDPHTDRPHFAVFALGFGVDFQAQWAFG